MTLEGKKIVYQDTKNQPGRVGVTDIAEYDPALEVLLKQAVTENIVLPLVEKPEDLPNIIILAGPCRTDTGALATVLSLSTEVHASHIQPFKTARRDLYSQIKTGSGIEYANKTLELTAGSGIEVIKETVGPKSQAEYFNPLEPLLMIGYPPEKILVVGTLRDPLEVLDSCVSMWDKKYITTQDINNSFLTIQGMFDLAQQHNVRAVPYIHEMPQSMGSHAYIEKLALLTGVTYDTGLVDWGESKGYENTVTYEIPPKRFVSGSVSKRQGGRGGFHVAPHKYVLPQNELAKASRELGHAYGVYVEMASRAEGIFSQI